MINTPQPVSNDPEEKVQDHASVGQSVQSNDVFELKSTNKTKSTEESFESQKDTQIGHNLGTDKSINKKTCEGKPFVKDQLTKYPDSCEVGRVENFVLDLGDKEDLLKLNELDTKGNHVDGGLIIQDRQIKFHESGGKWLAFLTVAYITFTSIV